ncbi:LytR C-terminal domain-containing protein [Noviherbaspirillum aerium]|uniref:LytR C-terminal domain-containing protein n=1 Tax=Noviherbaspirillum aerium TaxID=2588497 RepID=UPI00178C2AAC|nr:LytR C-terminal domain-containing protein [Noviherbaspirillum aerium]
MKFAKLSVPLACALSTLAALSMAAPAHAGSSEQHELNEQNELRIQPIVAIRHSDDSAESLYQLGRHHQQENRLDEAASAYRAALAKNENHLEARNGLATIYFAQKDMISAMAEFKTILQQQPALSHVRSNLGYAYMLEENYSAAMPELVQAIMLDPSNTRAFGNLTLAYERVGAIVNDRRAQAVAEPSAEAAPASAFAPAPAPAPELADAPAGVAEPAPAQTETTVHAHAPAPAPAAELAMETTLADQPPAGKAQAVPMKELQVAAVSAAAGAKGIVIEIANGTRDDALADRIASGLGGNGIVVSRTTALAPYTQQRTVILYRDGYRKQALQLSSMFAVPPAVVNNTRTRDAGDHSAVRLVLGKRSVLASIRSSEMQLAAR